jgi:hypothetical protein
MQAAGAISYKRGNLRVDNREVLKEMACECYGNLAVNPRLTTCM